MRTNIIALIACFFIQAFPRVDAQIMAVESISNPGGTYYGMPVDVTSGWRFTVGNNPISVTHLGFFDRGLDGLYDSHAVGIWDSAGTLLVQGTVPAGTSAPLTGAYRFTLVSPTTLNANTTYYVGAHNPAANDDAIIFGAPQIYASQISYEAATYAQGNGFAFPNTQYAAAHGVFGGNFQLTPVPEPHHYALITGVALIGFFWLRRTSERRA
jgi:hypothetical protein